MTKKYAWILSLTNVRTEIEGEGTSQILSYSRKLMLYTFHFSKEHYINANFQDWQ